MSNAIPVLWLCGPPGVGKTAVGWEVYQRLVAEGTVAAYLDVDQVGMCYPERADDPHRHRLKARNVAALRGNVAAEGAGCLIVSGVVDAGRGAETDIIEGPVLVARLRVDPDELEARTRARGGPFAGSPAAAIREADRLDRSSFADWTLDTTKKSVGETARLVLGLARPFLEGVRPDGSSPVLADDPAGELLWLCGSTGVGKSTIGFSAYLKVLGTGRTAAFVDIDQLGFFGQAASHALRARNLASVWANFHAAGATALVVVGPVDLPEVASVYEQALPNVRFTWCRLDASPAELTERVISRRDGGSWAQPGDPLRGRPMEELRTVAATAIARAAALEAAGFGVPVATDGLAPDTAAAAVLERTGWLSGWQTG